MQTCGVNLAAIVVLITTLMMTAVATNPAPTPTPLAAQSSAVVRLWLLAASLLPFFNLLSGVVGGQFGARMGFLLLMPSVNSNTGRKMAAEFPVEWCCLPAPLTLSPVAELLEHSAAHSWLLGSGFSGIHALPFLSFVLKRLVAHVDF